ncbi:efflux RND transporter periplasmic adaptor subunit [Photobacterium leiognathi]|uniref:efflux RND transporter periplasmic adaptor subunit n=1 Tax=Photobacterium leiognathi TaxID=553611 RepID=UPI00020881BD|nr:efflux RND transporter periplasmic adaptor subunit [Photobacterium leiognathi]PSV03358.1 efflux RND transporter periplasmic adaptor subunit [Photobacterium leiognathi subsp. mandapamensis]PSW54184.1 efflux RND transporter periplasmic adaptor subunit [Photobacterium leiognathi subsp. mandapamensis]PSW57679.1 efflux RND transporter periplasmic adaptor subunit [Photobacterium leiognathi subsp. mandapamensis]GAA03824.1 efflux transporter, RND family, MFP subunit [Photobacterium leiognathi subsp.
MRRQVYIAVLACVALIGCKEDKATVKEPESRPVKLQSVSVGDNESLRSFPAIVEAGDKAVLAFRVSGQLNNVQAHPGEFVRKGQTLATLNPDELSLLVKQAQAQYDLANVQFKRNSQLRKTNVVSELDYDASKANLKQAKAALDKAKSNLSYAKLIAPYDGHLSLSMIENFEYVAAKQPVMHIQSAKLINMTFQLPDYLLARFQGHAEEINPTVAFDALANQTFPAQFKEIDTEPDSKTSSYKVTLSMARPEGSNIMPGMSGSVTIVLPHGNAGAIPTRAVITEGNKHFVWRVNDKQQVERVEVTLDKNNRVISGLNDGDVIATSGVSELQAGQKVRSWIKERGL